MTKLLSKERLKEVYNIFKDNPIKTFVAKDFSTNGSTLEHLNLLVYLGVIEQVEAVVVKESKYGFEHRGRDVVGYRLKR